MGSPSGCAVGTGPTESLPRSDFVDLHDLVPNEPSSVLATRMLRNAVDTRQPMIVVDTKRSFVYPLLFPFFTGAQYLIGIPRQV